MCILLTMKDKIDSFVHIIHDTKAATSVCALVLATIIMVGTTITLPLQMVNAQNMTIKMSNATSSSNTDAVSSSVIANLAKPGYGYKYDVAMKGSTVPISYNILQGSLVGMLADPSRHSLDVAVNPSPNGGALEIQLPRHVIDSKNPTGSDMPFVVKMDGNRISGEPTGICIGSCPNIFNSYKETQNTNTDRVLTIVFGPESRFIEITGNTGV
jgi:hypothetical protein